MYDDYHDVDTVDEGRQWNEISIKEQSCNIIISRIHIIINLCLTIYETKERRKPQAKRELSE